MSNILANKNFQFLSIFENSGTIMLLIDPETHRIVLVNKAAEEFYGFEKEKFEQLLIDNINTLPPVEMQQEIAKAKNNNQIHFLFKHKLANGETRDVEVFFGKIIIADKVYLHSIIHEISTQVEAKISIQESEAYNRSLFELSPIGLVLTDMDGQLIDINPAYAAIIGRNIEETRELSYWDITPKKYAAEEEKKLKSLEKTGRYGPYEKEYIHKDGHSVPVRLQGCYLQKDGKKYIWSSVENITEQKQFRDKLLRNENRLQSLVNVFQFQSENEQEFLDYALAEAIKLTDSKIGYIYFYDDETEKFTLNTWSKGVMDLCSIQEPRNIYDLERTGIWGEAVRQRKEIIVNNFQQQHPLKKGYPDGHAELLRFMTIPVYSKDRIVAVLGLANKETDYSKQDVLQVQLLMDAFWKEAERKRGEALLAKSEERFRNIMASMNDIVFTLDQNQRHTGVYGPWVKKQGLSEEYFLGKTSGEILDNDSAKIHEKANEKALKGEFTTYDWSVTKDNASLYYQTTLSPIISKSGTIEGLVGVGRDITNLKLAEEALKASALQFQQLIEIMPISLAIVSLEGNVLYINPKYKELFGMTTIPESHDVYFHWIKAEDRRRWLEEIEKKGSVQSFEMQLKTFTGKEIWALGSGLFIQYQNQTCILSTHHDITEVKVTQLALQNEKDWSDKIINNAPNIIIGLDREAKIMVFNNHAEDITGYKSAEVLGKKWFDIFIRDNQIENLKQIWTEIVKQQSIRHQFENLIITKSNEERLIQWHNSMLTENGEVKMVLSIGVDITLKKQTEEKVKLMSRVVEASSVSIVITDSTGDISYVNPYFTELTGYTLAEVQGKNPRVLKSGNEPISFYQNLWDTILKGKDWQGEFLNKKKNGELYWERAVISPLINRKGEVTHFVAIKEDISERKAIYKELIEAKEKLEESDKLKTAFINNISHEIRTPLNGILGFGNMLATKDLSIEKRTEMFEHVRLSSNRLMDTISDYMDMAMLVSDNLKPKTKDFLIWPFFQEITEIGMNLCQTKNIDLKTEIPEQALQLSIHSDPEFLRKTMLQLLDNAIKFTHEGGKITCGFTIYEQGIDFFVEDTGKGIQANKQQLIFEMFSQEDTSMTRGHEGSGLGLSIAKGLVRLLGGDINVNSILGKGSKFSFYIPCHFSKIFDPNPDIEIPLKIQDKNLILIAEDDELNYEYLAIVIEAAGYNTIRATNGAEAVEFCRNMPEISLVLMDIKMPVLNGIEASRQIRLFMPKLPIIATTAFAQTGDENRILAAGCNAYLAKPIKADKLLVTIQLYLK